MVEAPIFHVNGDDPEAVVHAAKVATEFRQKFHKDVVIDIICYRRFGHNEGDEPMFTNPVMYKKIKKQKTTLTLYTERLVKDGLIPEGEIEDMKAAFQAYLNEEFEAGKEYRPTRPTGWMASGRISTATEEDTSAARPPSRRNTCRDRHRAQHRARRLSAAQNSGAPAGAKKPDVRNRRRLRLGHRRGAGLWLAADRRLPGPPVRSGQHARHLQPAPFGPDQPGHRRAVLPAQPYPRGAGPVRSHRLDAVRICGARASNTATRWPSPTR